MPGPERFRTRPLYASDVNEFFDTTRSSECATMPRLLVASTSGTLATGNVYGGLAVCRSAGSFTQIRFMTGSTAPSAITDVRVGVYDSSGNLLQGSGQLSATVTAASTLYTVALGGTVTLTKGQFVYLAFGCIGTTPFNLRGFATASNIAALTPVESRSVAGWTTGSALPAALSTAGTSVIPWMELVP